MEVPPGSLLLDQEANVIAACDSMARALGAIGLCIDRGRLQPLDPANRCWVSTLVRQSLERVRSGHARTFVPVPAPEGGGVVYLAFVRPEHGAATTNGAVPAALVSLRSPTVGEWFDADSLTDIFGLTQRELDLVRDLVRGHTVAEHANRLGLTQATIRTRLKHVYQKVGVHTQHQLVARALSLGRRT